MARGQPLHPVTQPRHGLAQGCFSQRTLAKTWKSPARDSQSLQKPTISLDSTSAAQRLLERRPNHTFCWRTFTKSPNSANQTSEAIAMQIGAMQVKEEPCARKEIAPSAGQTNPYTSCHLADEAIWRALPDALFRLWGWCTLHFGLLVRHRPKCQASNCSALQPQHSPVFFDECVVFTRHTTCS